MVSIETILSCLTIIEFLNLLIRQGRLVPSRIIKLAPHQEPELTEEMRAKIYS